MARKPRTPFWKLEHACPMSCLVPFFPLDRGDLFAEEHSETSLKVRAGKVFLDARDRGCRDRIELTLVQVGVEFRDGVCEKSIQLSYHVGKLAGQNINSLQL